MRFEGLNFEGFHLGKKENHRLKHNSSPKIKDGSPENLGSLEWEMFLFGSIMFRFHVKLGGVYSMELYIFLLAGSDLQPMLVPQAKKPKSWRDIQRFIVRIESDLELPGGFLLLHIFSFPFSEKDAPKKISLQYLI